MPRTSREPSPWLAEELVTKPPRPVVIVRARATASSKPPRPTVRLSVAVWITRGPIAWMATASPSGTSPPSSAGALWSATEAVTAAGEASTVPAACSSPWAPLQAATIPAVPIAAAAIAVVSTTLLHMTTPLVVVAGSTGSGPRRFPVDWSRPPEGSRVPRA